MLQQGYEREINAATGCSGSIKWRIMLQQDTFEGYQRELNVSTRYCWML